MHIDYQSLSSKLLNGAYTHITPVAVVECVVEIRSLLKVTGTPPCQTVPQQRHVLVIGRTTLWPDASVEAVSPANRN